MELETSPSPVGGTAWVYKRDGRLVPFEPDKISQALFAVTESRGRPDAFLARELADAVLHFLTAEADGAVPTTAQIADLIAKVVRELGQPEIAQAFADFAGQRIRDQVRPSSPEEIVLRFTPQDSPATVVASCLRAYSLQAIFSRDLAAAQADGLITLDGLEAPLQLASCLLDLPGEGTVFRERLAHHPGKCVVVDGLEYIRVQETGDPVEWVRDLILGIRDSGREVIVNLNAAVPPPWAEHLAEGPLFADRGPALSPDQREARSLSLLEGLLAAGALEGSGRIDWHLGESDLGPEAAPRLIRLARLALDVSALAFTFDRPRKEVSLAEGLDRRHRAVLQIVGLHLPRLAEMARTAGNPELFLHKLGSLTRLALSAGARKREFLRRHAGAGPLQRGFLLERARLVVVPVGLEAAARLLTGGELCTSRPAQELARKMVLRLREVLRQDGPAHQLDACLDSGGNFAAESVAGLTAWDPTASWRHQLRAAGLLHAAAEGGTAAVVLSPERTLAAAEAADMLRYAGQQTEIVRLRLVHLGQPERQLW